MSPSPSMPTSPSSTDTASRVLPQEKRPAPLPFTVAAIQTLSGEDVADNLEKTAFWVAQAAQAGAQLIVLPEYFALMSPDDAAKHRIAEPFGQGPLQAALSAMAARHGVWLIAGTLPLHATDPHKVRNTTLVFNAEGACVARYDKIHLFRFSRKISRKTEHDDGAGHAPHQTQPQGREGASPKPDCPPQEGRSQPAFVFDETQRIEPGEHAVTFESPFGRIGLAICYDLRFPELFRALGHVDLIALPAAFTHTTGQAHWETLLKARAIENLCPLVAANQGGLHAFGRRTFGHSLILDAWGGLLACHEEGWGMALAQIDPAHTQRMREDLPALLHRHSWQCF